ncbi:MAG: hypothetical protein IB618_03775 [Candidatus Pacearchaeota archaeon]|nr:MAG: hypothetical protein IB618_03775 [Candidatus Pacearchaeota archaeon]
MIHNNQNRVIGMLKDMYGDSYKDEFYFEQKPKRTMGYNGIIKDRPPKNLTEAVRDSKEFYKNNFGIEEFI